MKEYILLYCANFDNYSNLDKKRERNSLSQLFFMLISDFRPWDDGFLTEALNCYNASFIYHDFQSNILYMGCSQWSLSDEQMRCPEDKDFPTYVNESNSCKMSVDNYLEFRQKWVQLKQELHPFALIYRDDHDWVDCKGFDSQEEMELFVKKLPT